MELESVFYVMAIIFMSVMFIIMISIAVAVFVIKSKIDRIHQNIEDKLHMVTTYLGAGGKIATSVVKGIKKATQR